MKLSEFGGNLLFLEATPYNRHGYEAGPEHPDDDSRIAHWVSREFGERSPDVRVARRRDRRDATPGESPRRRRPKRSRWPVTRGPRRQRARPGRPLVELQLLYTSSPSVWLQSDSGKGN